jgi:hypothetical protein
MRSLARPGRGRKTLVGEEPVLGAGVVGGRILGENAAVVAAVVTQGIGEREIRVRVISLFTLSELRSCEEPEDKLRLVFGIKVVHDVI